MSDDPLEITHRTPQARPVLVVSPNYALDHVCVVPSLTSLTDIVRADAETITSGGKGTNVARALHNLSIPSRVLGITAGEVGSLVEDLARKEGLILESVRVGGETRIASIFIDSGSREALVINPPGPAVSTREWSLFIEGVRQRIDEVEPEFVVCTGSLPPGVTSDGYNAIVRHANGKGAFTIVDVAGPILAAVLEEGPRLVKVNLDEANSISDGVQSLPGTVERIRSFGAERAIITLAERGAIGSDAKLMIKAANTAVTVCNSVGAGDAFLAGLIHGFALRGEFADALRGGIAAGAASVESLVPADFTCDRYEVLFTSVRVEHMTQD